jgi:hypothetical protein
LFSDDDMFIEGLTRGDSTDRQLEQSIRSSEKIIPLVRQLSQLGEGSTEATAVTTGTETTAGAGGAGGGASSEDGGPGPSDSVSQTGSDDLDGEAEVAALAHKILELLGLDGSSTEASA